MSQLLTRSTAPAAIRFFYLCFQRGVLDACEFGNDIEAKEFLESKTSDWTFGTLSHQDDFDWKAFRAQLYWLARENRMTGLAENYLFRIKAKNYTWCILPYCMRFYLMGIREWLAYPNPGRIEYFKQVGREHWDPNSKIKKMTRMDIISYLHNFEYEYRSAGDVVVEVSENSMSSFIMALYDLSKKYVTGNKEDEDI